MITLYAPLKRSNFEKIDFGAVEFTYPEPGLTSSVIDEIIVSNVGDGDNNQIDFIKRYNTWFAFTSVDSYPLIPYSVTLIHYDRVNRIAYTAQDTLKVLRKP
jgi:hypothetical protein